MGVFQLEFDESEMKELMEICSLALHVVEQSSPGDAWIARRTALTKLCHDVLEAARVSPSLSQSLAPNARGRYEYSKTHAQQSYYRALCNSYRESAFWEELVSRLCETKLKGSLGHLYAEQLREMPPSSRTETLLKVLREQLSPGASASRGYTPTSFQAQAPARPSPPVGTSGMLATAGAAGAVGATGAIGAVTMSGVGAGSAAAPVSPLSKGLTPVAGTYRSFQGSSPNDAEMEFDDDEFFEDDDDFPDDEEFDDDDLFDDDGPPYQDGGMPRSGGIYTVTRPK